MNCVHIVVYDNKETNTEILAVFENLKDAERFRDKEINKENIFIVSREQCPSREK